MQKTDVTCSVTDGTAARVREALQSTAVYVTGDSEGREEGSPRQGGGGRRRPRRQRPRRSRGESDGEDRKDR